MAYDISTRIPEVPQKRFVFYDPGAYQTIYNNSRNQVNKVPFLSDTPRKTLTGNKLYTHAIYNAEVPRKIPNITSLSSKLPRFPYEPLSDEDIKQLLCRCGIDNTCDCPVEEDKVDLSCNANVRRRLFKGPSPKIRLHRIDKRSNQPPFYNVNIRESNAFYHGCKWSKWTSKRSSLYVDPTPDPTHYNIENSPAFDTCSEKFRAYRRKTCKQLRFMEYIQQKNISDNLPGPDTYNPVLRKGTDLKYIGPKADRFPNSKYDQKPGPADHEVKRDFEQGGGPPDKPCLFKLPEPAFFGMKSNRFKPLVTLGPGPATYSPSYRPCLLKRFSSAAFGSTLDRFKDEVPAEYNDTVSLSLEQPLQVSRPSPTWQFKSKPKIINEMKRNESPIVLPSKKLVVKRLPELQYNAPFYSSGGRFDPWYDWISVYGKDNYPGPCYYSLNRPKCSPAVRSGPLSRQRRFFQPACDTPAPNEYYIENGIKSVLSTYNYRLKDNIRNKHKFIWHPPTLPKRLNREERELLLLNRCIELIDEGYDTLDSEIAKSREKPTNIRLHKKQSDPTKHNVRQSKVATKQNNFSLLIVSEKR